MLDVDLEPPRPVRRLAVQLLVEPVPEPADRLSEGKPGRREVEDANRVQPADPGPDDQCDPAPERGAEDPEPPTPDIKWPLARRARATGDEVIQPPADQRARQRREAEPEHVPGVLPAPARDERARDAEDDRPESDEQAVPVAAEGSEPQLRRPGARHVLLDLPRRSFGRVRNGHCGIV